MIDPIESSAIAMQELHADFDRDKPVMAQLDGRLITLAPRADYLSQPDCLPIVGRGSIKRIYDLKDGKVMAISKIDFPTRWHGIVTNECTHAKLVSEAGLHTLPVEQKWLEIGTNRIPVLVMPSFSALEDKGLQVRDTKNREVSHGHSMLFGNEQNALDQKYWKQLMEGFVEDSAKLISHNYWLGPDSTNLLIKDTREIPPDERSKPDLIGNRDQKAQFFLFDLHAPLVSDVPGSELDDETMRRMAGYYMLRAFDCLLSGIRQEERDIIAPADPYTFFSRTGPMRREYDMVEDELIEKIIARVYEMRQPPTVLPGGGNPQTLTPLNKELGL